MLRYNRTFVGLMEQCNDGEWIKAQDYEDKVGELLTEYNKRQLAYIELQGKYIKELDWGTSMLEKLNRTQDIKFFSFAMVVLVIFVPLFLRLVI